MLFLDLGKRPGHESMLVFHALARMGIEALVLVSPQNPLASIGYFQDAAQEIDIPYCIKARIPLMRREVGGGATYLDENQIFYQLIWRKDNPRFPRAVEDIFPWFSEAPVETYRAFGIPAEYRPVNDIVTKEGRKIAGQGGGDVGECMVFVGGILLDFDYNAMSRILKVPDEKFRDKVYKTMEANLTTMKKELGRIPPREDIVTVLREEFERKLGKLEPVSLSPEIRTKMRELESWMTSDAFLHQKTPRVPKGVKIKEGLVLLYGIHKARGGLLRTVEEISQERIQQIGISGDLTVVPREGLRGLETSLTNVRLEEAQIRERIDSYYEAKKIETPGVDSGDFAKTILSPVQKS